MPSSQPLPPKEKTLFNRILKCYEQKQYKNGLKFAKQILSNPKFSDHGETLAMKGLTLNCTGKKEEAYELVKRGLKNDLKSHVCWHVYGLLQRSDKKYDEAIKCYRNALRWDKENLHILRDLSMLQVHMRDLEGYRETRYSLLQLKPGHRASWIGYAISNHLLKDYLIAFNVLEEFAKTQQSDEAQYDHSELLLYQAEILKEAGFYRRALSHIEEHKSRILDKLGYLEMKGELLVVLEEFSEAEEVYTNLLYRNPENHSYFEMLETILKPSGVDDRLQIYQTVSSIFPKADSPKILPLSFATESYERLVLDSTFRTLLKSYMRLQLQRGVPPLFTTLKPLYKDHERVRMIGQVVEEFLSSLNRQSKFSDEDSELQPPTTLLWTNFYHAQHLDAIGKYEEALVVVDRALEHTPTLIELHLVKAKILKHLGDFPAAVACMDEAQSLDTADRFINCKCACYMIRNDMIREADATAAKFTRENTSVEDYLREMQCMWYEVECARTHMKANRFGEALRKCHDVEKHFFEIAEDQFDFHQYCMRKMTLRSYVRMLMAEDSIKSHRFYYQAATIAIKVYLHLHDEPYRRGGAEEERDGLTKAEVKRLKVKQKRLEKKKAAAEEKKKQQENASKKRHGNQKNQKQDEENETKKEDYVTPEALASVSDPLEQARKFLIPLELHCVRMFATHFLAFQVAERKGRLLVMLRAFLRARKTATPDDEAELHFCRVQFAKHVNEAKDLSCHVSDVINLHVDLVHDKEDAESLNEKFLSKNSDSLPHVFAAARAMYYLDHSRQEEAVNLLLGADFDLKGTTWKMCEKILQALRSKPTLGTVSQDAIAKYMKKCKDLFPRASVFLSASDREMKKLEAEAAERGNAPNGVDDHVMSPSPDGDIELPPASAKDCAGKVEKLLNNESDAVYENGIPERNHCPATV